MVRMTGEGSYTDALLDQTLRYILACVAESSGYDGKAGVWHLFPFFLKPLLVGFR